MRTIDTTVDVLPTDAAKSDSGVSAELSTIISLEVDGAPQIAVAGIGQVRARLAMAATLDRLHEAILHRQQAVVIFEGGDRSKPIIVGFLEPAPVQTAEAQASGHTSSEDANATPPVVEADVDGRRVRLTARDEIVLQCGGASITLRRNGRVVIRGSFVETHSDGTNRIKGGQVLIN